MARRLETWASRTEERRYIDVNINLGMRPRDNPDASRGDLRGLKRSSDYEVSTKTSYHKVRRTSDFDVNQHGSLQAVRDERYTPMNRALQPALPSGDLSRDDFGRCNNFPNREGYHLDSRREFDRNRAHDKDSVKPRYDEVDERSLFGRRTDEFRRVSYSPQRDEFIHENYPVGVLPDSDPKMDRNLYPQSNPSRMDDYNRRKIDRCYSPQRETQLIRGHEFDNPTKFIKPDDFRGRRPDYPDRDNFRGGRPDFPVGDNFRGGPPDFSDTGNFGSRRPNYPDMDNFSDGRPDYPNTGLKNDRNIYSQSSSFVDEFNRGDIKRNYSPSRHPNEFQRDNRERQMNFSALGGDDRSQSEFYPDSRPKTDRSTYPQADPFINNDRRKLMDDQNNSSMQRMDDFRRGNDFSGCDFDTEELRNRPVAYPQLGRSRYGKSMWLTDSRTSSKNDDGLPQPIVDYRRDTRDLQKKVGFEGSGYWSTPVPDKNLRNNNNNSIFNNTPLQSSNEFRGDDRQNFESGNYGRPISYPNSASRIERNRNLDVRSSFLPNSRLPLQQQPDNVSRVNRYGMFDGPMNYKNINIDSETRNRNDLTWNNPVSLNKSNVNDRFSSFNPKDSFRGSDFGKRNFDEFDRHGNNNSKFSGPSQKWKNNPYTWTNPSNSGITKPLPKDDTKDKPFLGDVKKDSSELTSAVNKGSIDKIEEKDTFDVSKLTLQDIQGLKGPAGQGLVLVVHALKHEDPEIVLQRTGALCKQPYLYYNKFDNLEERWKCDIGFGKKVYSTRFHRNKMTAKILSLENALNKMANSYYVLKIKNTYFSNGYIVTRSGELVKKDVKDTLSTETRFQTPVEYDKIKKIIEDYDASDDIYDLVFSYEFSKRERKRIVSFARELKLFVRKGGNEIRTHLVLKKKVNNIWNTIEKLIAGDKRYLEDYELLPPGTLNKK
ncbi:uncharacterized protein LOC142331577 [Lycorma delicatula]|uniref:uncharacterized protein LOC142331577 n=1 Tax=Lycorma delicatula TaxID=130591 RepID=UPI003F519011